jgi:hypothetical protein
MKKISNWLFRSDLELNKRWWHRALLSFYFIALTLTLVTTIIISFTDEKQYIKVSPISEYFNSRTVKLQEIIESNPNYKLGEVNHFSKYGNSIYRTYIENTFCGKDIANGLDKYTVGDKIVSDFMVNRKYVDIKTLEENLLSTKTECITIDSYNRAYFIEPYEDAKEMWFYEYSLSKTILNTFIYISYAILVFLSILVFYYKVVLYVIFGNKKN